MQKSRREYFSKLSQEEKYELSAKDFTVREIREIISETSLNATDIKIAECRYIMDMTMAAIAKEVGLDEKTIQRKIPKISDKLKRTLQKLL
ncbi:MAG: hypothetical protein J5697_00475 [Clostridia bacterium]|nr:hypothetical protein [Clostridia bacterium]